MRVSITGGSGLLGNNVIRQALLRGWQVVAAVRSDVSRPTFAGLNVEFRKSDLSDPASLPALAEGVDAIIHCAGFIHIGWTKLEESRRINVAGTAALARAARERGVPMVHVSTVNTLGRKSIESPADETTKLEDFVACSYVVTKREAEEAVKAEQQKGLRATIVYPGFMLGPYDWKPSSGKMMLETMQQKPLVYPTGGCSVCDARDVADGTLAIVEKGLWNDDFCLAGYNLSYRDLWTRFAELGGHRKPVWPIGPAIRAIGSWHYDRLAKKSGDESEINSAAIAMGSQCHCYSSDKAKRAFGYSNRPLDETLNETFAWFRDNGYFERFGIRQRTEAGRR